jgi:hypothetical protein
MAPAATKAAPTPTPTTPRMSLGSIVREIKPRPDRILIVGTEGVGKTSFAAEAPSPIFICAEDGLPPVLGEVARFPTPESLTDVLDAIRTLIREEHPYRTFVVDTIDWLEPVIWRELCTRNNWTDIEAPGYGKGYVAAADEWRRLLAALDTLRDRKGMEVILLAHAAIRVFQNPAGGDYSRYECKLNKNAAALVKEWTDVNLFAVHEEFVQVKNGKETRKGISTGRRVIHTERTAAWDAKNRYALPTELPLCYADYAEARAACSPADPAELTKEAESLIAALELDKETTTKTEEWLGAQKARGTASLARAVDRLRSKVAEKGAA